MLPRSILKDTPLIRGGHLDATIVYPSCHPAYALLAQKLAAALEGQATNQAALFEDRALIPANNVPFPERYRSHPLILLGNLNTNRVLLPLYARYYCFTDATYPGGDGYDLRTMVNPYGQGANVILAGGSSLEGVGRAVERLVGHIQACAGAGELVLPFLLEVELELDLIQKFYSWPEAPLVGQAPDGLKVDEDPGGRKVAGDPYGLILPADAGERLKGAAAYGTMYALTGDRRFGEIGGQYLRLANAQMTDSYGDRHYFIERVMRALPWLAAGGFLDDADLLRTDQLLMGMALGSQDMWWRMKSAKPPLGHRHHGKGTFEFYLIARYLREQAAPEPELAALCDRWIVECQAFLDALGRAGIDDQDDESTLNNLASVFWYALSEERFDFFESGSARAWAQRVIALHDNMGCGAGLGGYGKSLLSMAYVQAEATIPIAACAFYYQDGRFKWILENMPRLNPPLRGGFLSFCPIYIHKFDTGPELAPQEPQDLTGLQVLPATRYQVELNNNPPRYIEYAGHMVNAPETWMPGEGIGANTLPPEKGFDKIVLRGGYHRPDPYLIVQGYQGGFRWQGHMRGANCIIRFSQAGHIFLVQNTRAHSQYFKNGVLVSDGFNDQLTPPIAEWLAVDDFGRAGLSVSRLNDYHHTAWSRHIFWSKGLHDFFVVLDSIAPQADGDYSAVCTWRTPGYAALEGRTWRADQGDHTFILCASEDLPALCEEERDQGAVNPYVLHQFQGGRVRQGEQLSFQNIFYVRRTEAPEQLDLRRCGPGQALVLRDGKPVAWVSAGPAAPASRPVQALGLEFQAASAFVTPTCIWLAGATQASMAANPAWTMTSDTPLGVELDLERATFKVRLDGPAVGKARVTLTQEDETRLLVLEGDAVLEVRLPVDLCQAWAAGLGRTLAAAQPSEPPVRPAPVVNPDGWRRSWQYDAFSRVPLRLRQLTVQASPPPLDGIPEQLVDTVPVEVRETWQYWPPASHYEITLAFPQERSIESLNLVGDSMDEPLLRIFSPLPAGIHAEASSDGFIFDIRSCPVDSTPGFTSFMRFRGILDRLESRRVVVGQAARQVRVTIPAPQPGLPTVFQEIEVFGTERVLPGIKRLLSANLEDGGRQTILAVTAANELVALDEAGRERWRYAYPGLVDSLSCHDLLGDGRLFVCAGLVGGRLVILAPDGALWKDLELSDEFFGRGDAFMGWLYTIHSLAIWRRDERGRACLVLGSYAVIVFLDADGRIVGHSWADAPWLLNILAVPAGEPDAGDLWVRCGWNHGVGHYQGQEGSQPSGQSMVFGGVSQPMFRALRKIIPFVNGRSAGFEWFTANPDLGRVIVAAAEDGVGVLSTRTQEFLWKVEGGTTVTACLALATRDGQGQVLVGGVDGFVAAFGLPDGRPLRKWWAGAPVVGLVSLNEAGGWVAATRQGVWTLDGDWNVLAFHPLPAVRLAKVGSRQVIIACQDGSLVSLTAAS